MWYYRDIKHDGLNKYRRIRGYDPNEVEQKAQAQMMAWEEMWEGKQEAEGKRQERERAAERTSAERARAAKEKEAKKQVAAAKTEKAQKSLEQIENTLLAALDVDRSIHWEKLKDFSAFGKPRPKKPKSWEQLKDCSAFSKPRPQEPELRVEGRRFYLQGRPPKPQPLEIAREPTMYDPKYRYQHKPGFLERFFDLSIPHPQLRDFALYQADREQWLKAKQEIIQKNEESRRQYFEDLRKWEAGQAETKQLLEEQYPEDLKKWEAERQHFLEEQQRKNEAIDKQKPELYAEDLRKWEAEAEQFLQEQERNNQAIDKQKEDYFSKRQSAVTDYCRRVVSNSNYPHSFPREYDLDYNPETKTLVVEYRLPSPQDLPTLKEVKYVQSTDEFKESHLSDSAFNKIYDALLYKIALRSIYELYQADVAKAIDSIVFNGWVNSVDRGTGKGIRPCILSVYAGRDEFLSINLAQVDPKACFRKLKGVAASELHAISPVPPIMTIDREDARFIPSYQVEESLDESQNIAAMDWQDFEHLVRELFEKEFAPEGGEVKVTRASRDYGVDAIAFDPDPIRGGKIVIQAKRYTNVVGVSAVRDLYGTVINEGAMKGILITTADYGPEAYEFAKGKPLTLLGGGHLLHLLAKHGHRARIDLKEAKQILAEGQE